MCDSPLGSESASPRCGLVGTSKSAQTDHRSTTSSSTQTRKRNTSELSLADHGSPGQPIVDDDVVEYADAASPHNHVIADSDPEEEEIMLLAIGPSGLAVSVPQHGGSHASHPSTNGAVGPQTDAEVEALHAKVRTLKAELDDQRNATVLREKELHSIVESCRGAFEKEFNARASKIEADRAQQAEGLHRTIRTLHEAIGNLEATVAEKDLLLAQHEKITAETVREKCREWKLVEASLQMELGRMRGEREKTRFEAEVAEHRGRNHLIEAKTLAIRAHEAEERWSEKILSLLAGQEERERDLVEAHALDSLATLVDTCTTCAKNVDVLVAGNRSQWVETLTLATQTLLPAIPSDEQTALVDSSFSRDRLVFAGSKVFAKILDRVSLAQQEEADRQKFYEQDMQQRLLGLASEVQIWNDTLDGVRKAADTRLEKLAMRCSSVEKVSQSLAEKSDVFAKKRADRKARASVLDDLVAEHAAETEEMSREIKQLRQENDLLRITNKITEAEELRLKLTKCDAALKLSQQENGQLRMKLSTLEATCQNMENGSRHHFSALEKAQIELTTVRQRMEDREAAHETALGEVKARERLAHAEIQELRRVCSAHEDVIKSQRVKVMQLEKSIETLREKYRRELEGAAARSGTSAEPEESLEVVALRQKVVMMKREIDALARKLDAALAEASHAEEHRLGTVNRCLTMMAAEDAAPRREQLIIGQQMQLQRDLRALEAREAELLSKQATLERKESAAKRLMARNVRSVDTTQPLDRSHSEVLPVAVESGSARQSSAGSNNSSSVYRAPVKLAPLTQRPPQQSEPTVEHPQRLA